LWGRGGGLGVWRGGGLEMEFNCWVLFFFFFFLIILLSFGLISFNPSHRLYCSHWNILLWSWILPNFQGRGKGANWAAKEGKQMENWFKLFIVLLLLILFILVMLINIVNIGYLYWSCYCCPIFLIVFWFLITIRLLYVHLWHFFHDSQSTTMCLWCQHYYGYHDTMYCTYDNDICIR